MELKDTCGIITHLWKMTQSERMHCKILDFYMHVQVDICIIYLYVELGALYDLYI